MDSTISPNDLQNFLSVLGCSTNAVEQLAEPSFIRSLIHKIDREYKLPTPDPDASKNSEIGKLLTFIDDTLSGKYSPKIVVLQNDISELPTLSLLERLRLGELLIILSVESARAAEIVGMIMADLNAECQLAIQRTIEKYAGSEFEDGTESGSTFRRLDKTDFTGSELSLEDDLNSQRACISRPLSPNPMVPPLSLGLLRKQSTKRFRNPFVPVFSQADTGGETDIWKEKYDKLREEYGVSESAKEELQQKLELTKKELEEQQQANTRMAKAAKEASSASQKTLGEAFEALEREVVELRNRNDESTKEKKEMERTFQSEISRLQDENQLLNVDAAKVERLEATVEKLKSKAEELIPLKSRNQELEDKLEEYVGRLVEAENSSQGAIELKKQLESYKKKIAKLEADNSSLTAISSELQEKLALSTTTLEETERRRVAIDIRMKSLVSEYEHKLHEVQQCAAVESGLGGDLNVREKLLRLEKENEILRSGGQSVDGRILELECQLDDAIRLKEKFEREYQSTLSRLSLMETEPSGDVKLQQVQIEKEIAVLQARLESMDAQNKSLTAQLDQEKTTSKLQEDALRSRIENQYDTIVSTLKEQVQLREREVNFLRLTREEQLSAQRREERLMSSAFHELGFRYCQLLAKQKKKESEYEAVLIKMQKKKKKPEEEM